MSIITQLLKVKTVFVSYKLSLLLHSAFCTGYNIRQRYDMPTQR